jgi:hypothetical protein
MNDSSLQTSDAEAAAVATKPRVDRKLAYEDCIRQFLADDGLRPPGSHRPRHLRMIDKPTFPAGTTDQEKADICRSELRPLLEQVAAIASRMMKDGMQLAFRIGPDQYGRIVLHGIDITKPL